MASQDKLSRPSKSLHSFVLDWSHGNQFCIDRSQAKLNIKNFIFFFTKNGSKHKRRKTERDYIQQTTKLR